MSGREIVRELRARRDNKEIIRWWRKENDFVDYELVDSFIRHNEPGQEFEGYELVDKEEMFKTLKQNSEGHVKRIKERGKEMLLWEHPNGRGEVHQYKCPFTAKALVNIFNEETGGDAICSTY